MSRSSFFYDRQGRPIDAERLEELWEDDDYRRIGLDVHPRLEDVADGDPPGEPIATISTVWLGINHSPFTLPGCPGPVIFETMIFGGPYTEECFRYTTEQAALDGHRRVVENLRAGVAPWWLRDEVAEADE